VVPPYRRQGIGRGAERAAPPWTQLPQPGGDMAPGLVFRRRSLPRRGP
jgi:hypothetical protein